MQGWSWMAALTLVAASAGALAPTDPAGQPTPIKQKVKLSSASTASRPDGEIVIKPGHAGCRFETITFRTKTHRRRRREDHLDPFEVETVSADRDCSFAITLQEPGQADKTVRRDLRIVAAADGGPPPRRSRLLHQLEPARPPRSRARRTRRAEEMSGDRARDRGLRPPVKAPAEWSRGPGVG